MPVPSQPSVGHSTLPSGVNLYDSLFGSSFCVYNMSLDGLLPILSNHGIDLPEYSTDVDARVAFIDHIFLGRCCDRENAPFRYCRLYSNIFVTAEKMSEFFCTSVIRHENDSVKLNQVCKALGMTDRECAVARGDRRCFVKYLTYCQTAFRDLPSIDSILCSIDNFQSFDLHLIARVHGIKIDKPTNVEAVKCLLIDHVANRSCYLSAECNIPFCRPDMSDDNVNVSKLRLIDLVLSGDAPKRILRRVFASLAMSFTASADKKELQSLLREKTVVLRSDIRNHNRRLINAEKRAENEINMSNKLDSIKREWPNLVDSDRKKEIIADFRASVSCCNLSEFVCSVCGESKRKKEFAKENVPATHPSLSVLRKPYPENVPNPFASNRYLKDFILEPKGIIENEGGNIPHLRMCKLCYSSTVKKGNKSRLPRLALANGLYLGPVPDELRDLTVVEEAMIAKRRCKCWVIHLRDSTSESLSSSDTFTHHVRSSPISQRGLKGHIIVYPTHPENLDNILPVSMSDTVTRLCVVFVGSKPPTKEWLRTKAKPLIVRREKVRAALIWLKQNNPLYKDVIINESLIDALPEEDVIPVDISVQDSSENSDSEMSAADIAATEDDCLDKPILFQNAVVSDIEGHDVSRAEISSKAIKHLKSGGGFVQMPHDASPTNEYTDADLFPCIYPTLFPYGVGGYRQPGQEISLGLENYARHLFSLRDRRFQEHYSFLFVIFNIIQRRLVARSGKFKMSMASFPSFAAQMSSLSIDALKNMADNTSTNFNREAYNEDERLVQRLMREVSLVTSNVPGSAAARVKMRNEIRGMIMDQGLPSFYITINPADIYNPIVRFLSSNDQIVSDLIDYSECDDLPDYWKQALSVAGNPFVASKFFDIYIQAFIDTVLCYDPSKKLQTAEGILGYVKCYYGCVEAQGRGTLHCHMLVWIHGALDPQEIKDRVLLFNDVEFRDRLIRFLDDTIRNDIPPVPETDLVVPIPYANYHACAAPILDPMDISEYNVSQRQKNLQRLVNECQLHKHTASCYKYCTNTSEKECRYNLDESNFVPFTTMDMDTGELEYQILNGLVNNYCPTILEAIRCNMDIKFIGSGVSAKAILYYVTDYITKTQLKTHVAYGALYTAVLKLQSQSQSGTCSADIDRILAMKCLLVKCANALISKQELSAPQVASYLMNRGDHYTSHKFQSLFWTSFEKLVENSDPISCHIDPNEDESVNGLNNERNNNESNTASDEESPIYEEITVEKNKDGSISAKGNQVMDYLHRPDLFNNLCLWDFVASVKKVPNGSKTKSTGDEVDDSEHDDSEHEDDEYSMLADDDTPEMGKRSNPYGSLKGNHPQSSSHLLQMRNAENYYVPVPVGPGIYRRDREQVFEKYCRLMLILFKPWSEVGDIRGNAQNWSSAFRAYYPSLSKKHKQIIENMQRLHECKDSRDEHFIKRRSKKIRNLSSDFVVASENTELNIENHNDDEINDALVHLDDLEDMYSANNARELTEIDSAISAATNAGFYDIPSLSTRDSYCATPLSSNSCNWPSPTLVDGITVTSDLEKEWQNWYNAQNALRKKQLSAENEGQSTSIQSSATHEPIISLADIYHDVSANAIIPESVTSPPFPTESTLTITNKELINEIAQEYTLNREQTLAFKIVAEHSVQDTQTPSEPLRLYLGGPGGTGKSRVINALRSFFERKGQSRRLRLSAFMGVAAHNIDGSTLHSLLSLASLNNRKNSNRTKEDLISMWNGVDYLFIDEISMVGCNLLANISDALSIAKQCTDIPFGGVNIIFAGDFCQLKPVSDKSLYAEVGDIFASPADEQTNHGQNKIKGRLLWLELTHCIMLHQQMRQAGEGNEALRDTLGRLRYGVCSYDDHCLLQSREMSKFPALKLAEWHDAPILTTKNSIKDALNFKAVETFAKKTNREVLWYTARDYHKGKQVCEEPLKSHLLSLNLGKTNQSMGRLPLVEGMPVIITKNFDIGGGVVNGTRGILKSVRYKQNEQGERHAISCVVIVESKKDDESTIPHLESNEIVVLEETVKIVIENPITHSKMTITRKQLPIQPCYAMTDFKSQGQTFSRVIVDLTSCRGSQSPYVMVSRTKSLEGLLILRPFDIARIQSHIPQSLRKEMQRLQELNNATVEACTSRSSSKRIHDEIDMDDSDMDSDDNTSLNQSLTSKRLRIQR